MFFPPIPVGHCICLSLEGGRCGLISFYQPILFQSINFSMNRFNFLYGIHHPFFKTFNGPLFSVKQRPHSLFWCSVTCFQTTTPPVSLITAPQAVVWSELLYSWLLHTRCPLLPSCFLVWIPPNFSHFLFKNLNPSLQGPNHIPFFLFIFLNLPSASVHSFLQTVRTTVSWWTILILEIFHNIKKWKGAENISFKIVRVFLSLEVEF